MNTFRIISSLCFPLVVASAMQAQVNAIFVDPVTIEPGETTEIVVRINYDISHGYPYEEINAYSFHILLPEGIVPNTKSGNWTRKCFSLSEETHPLLYDEETEEYTANPKNGLNIYTTDEGGAILVWFDPQREHAMTSTHGELMRISVKASSDFVRGSGKLYDIMLTHDSYAFDLYNIADVPIVFNEDATTVTSVVHDALADAPLYTLQGIKTKGAKKGLYIRNGKKILIGQ